MQAEPEEIPPPGVVFDSDFGTIDDVLALALLYGIGEQKKSEARLASVSVSRPDLQAAAFVEAVGGFYSDIANREIPERFRRRRSLPVGLADGLEPGPTPAMIAEPLARKNAEGEPLYPNEIHKVTDTAEVAALIRNALTAYNDQNCLVLLAGPATDLVRVLDVDGAKGWIEAKVRFLSAALGDFETSAADPHAAADIKAAQRLFDEWPGPIVAVGREIGEAVRFPAAALDAKFSWADRHPIVDAYRAAGEMPYDAPTWSLAAALYAVRPDGGYFKLSEPGRITVGDDGRVTFTLGGHGRHRRLIFDPEQKQALVDAYVELASAEPAPRELPGFLKRIIEEQKKKEEEEKLQKEQQPASEPKP